MSLPNEVISGLLSSSKDEDAYQVSRSLRFNSADSTYLTRSYSTNQTNADIQTFSFWIKRTSFAANQIIFHGLASSQRSVVRFTSSDQIEATINTSYNGNITTAVLRDASAWYHIVIAFDSTQAAAADRAKIYVNGAQLTSLATTTNVPQNTDCNFGKNGGTNEIGRSSDLSQYFNGYLAETYFIDGQALTPSSFGQSDTNGRWVPKAYTGTYGTNGFYLKFADNSGTTATTLGKDSSPNGNNWTPTNFSVTAGTGNDSLVDSPTNYGTDTGLGGEVRGNYATLNRLDAHSSATILNGNLQIYSASAAYHTARCSMTMMSGKWYAESLVGGDWLGTFGIASILPLITSFADTTFTSAYVILNNGGGTRVTRNNNSDTNSRTADTANDIWQIAFDADSNKLWLGRNNTWFGGGNPSTGTTPTYTVTSGVIYAMMASGGNGSGQPMYVNFGQRPFAYTAPSGFKSLCTQNLPTPKIKKPSQYMNIVTYTGTGATRSITGVGFQPDLVWTKSRSNAETHKLVDSVRGATKALSTETTGDEVTESGLTSFDSDGFTIDGTTDTGYNTNTYTYVGWAWKKGVTPGFDIVTYTGNGSARTISHSLGAVPHFMIVKARTTAGTDQGWPVYHRNLTSASYYILLNSNLAEVLSSTAWNGTAPTSSVFSVGTSALTNTNNDTYVAYLWTEIAGFSRFGTYTGNGAADGPFVWCAFRPRYIIIKDSNNSNLGFRIYDTTRETFNVMSGSPEAYLNSAEGAFDSNRALDITSNGFKIRTSATGLNASGTNYIFAAFAEAPFKYSRGR